MSGNYVKYTKQNMQCVKVQGYKRSSVFKNLVDIYKYKSTMLQLFHCGTLLPSPPEGANCLQSRLTSCRRRLRKSWLCWDRDWMRHWSRRGEPCIADWLRRGGSSYLTWLAEVDIHRPLLQGIFVWKIKSFFLPCPGEGPQTETEGPVEHVQGSGGRDRGRTASALLAEFTDSSQLGASRAYQQPGWGSCCRHPQGATLRLHITLCVNFLMWDVKLHKYEVRLISYLFFRSPCVWSRVP